MSKDWVEPYPEEIRVKIHVKKLENKLNKLTKQIREANSVIKLYAESKIGKPQGDGTYIFNNNIGVNPVSGATTLFVYDPRPAIDYLKKWKVRHTKEEQRTE